MRLAITITVFTELFHNMQPVQRPEKGWMIATGDTTDISDPLAAGANVITGIVEWDMSMFNDTPDYKIMTGVNHAYQGVKRVREQLKQELKEITDIKKTYEGVMASRDAGWWLRGEHDPG